MATRVRTSEQNREANRRWKEKNPDKAKRLLQESSRRWKARNPDKVKADRAETNRLYKQTHPHRHAISMLVYYAVKVGLLVKLPCVICMDPVVQAHHHISYRPENALDVVWLCKKHHDEAHRA